MQMKFNLEKWLLCLSAVAGLVGCQQEETAISPQTEAVLFGTQDDFRTDARTRSVIGGMLADGSLSVQWGVGDRIGVFGTQSVNAPFTSTNSEPAAETDFKGTITAGEELLYAYYPYAEGVTNVQAIPVTIPSEQAYADETSVGQYDVKASASITAQADGSYKLAMRQMVTLLRFEINLTEVKQIIGGGISEEVPGTERLRKAVVTTSSNLTGSYTYDLANLDGGLKAGEKSANSLTLSFTNAPALSETVIAYAIVVPGKHQGTKLLCELQTDSYSVAVTATMLCDFEAGKYYVVPLNASVYNNTENETVVSKLPEPEPQEETANCYMINTPGEHSFLATQIGNGDKGIIPGAGFHVTSAAISPKSAKLLWQDVEGFIQASSVRLGDDGRVHYTAAKNVGNALIAVYSGENCAGDILWSWHIWGVGDTMPQDFTYETRTVPMSELTYGSVQMMDRDLGAFPATDAERSPEAGGRDASIEARVINAMLYQWGRKDPFPNSGKYYDAEGQEIDLLAKSYNILKPTAGEATIQYAVRNPASFIDLYSTASVSDWLYEHNDLLWGDERFSAHKVDGWSNVKTIYDPSPVGYRVPNYYAYTYFIPVNTQSSDLKGVMGMTIPADGGESYPALCDKINCVIDAALDGNVTRYLPKGITMNRIGMSVDGKKQHGYGIFMKRNANDADGNFFAQTGYLQGGGSRGYYGISSYRWMSCGAVTNTIDCAISELSYFAWRTAQSNYQDSDHNMGLPSGSAGVVGLVRSQYSLQPRYGCAVRCVRDGSSSGKTYDSSYENNGVGFGVQ